MDEYQQAIENKDHNDLQYQKYLFFLDKSETTVKNSYNRYINMFIDFFKGREINQEGLILFSKKLEQELPRSAVQTAIYACRGFLKFLHIDPNCNLVKTDMRVYLNTKIKHANQRDQDNLTVEKIKEVFEQAEQEDNFRDLTMFQLLFFLSLRVSELAKLKRSHFVDNNDFWKVNLIEAKGNKDRIVYLDKSLITNDYFKNFLKKKQDVFLFPNKEGQIINTKVLRSRFSKYFNNGVIHRLRHTSAQYLIDSGLNLNQIKQQLGHSNIETTTKYLAKSLDPENLRNAFKDFSSNRSIGIPVQQKKPKKELKRKIEVIDIDDESDVEEIDVKPMKIKQETQQRNVLRKHGRKKNQAIDVESFNDDDFNIKVENSVVKKEKKRKK